MSKTALVVLAMIVWAGLSTFWYVCPIKGFCGEEPAKPLVKAPEPVPVKPVPKPTPKPVPAPEPKPAPVEEVMEEKPFICTDYLTGSLKLGNSANTAADAKLVEEFLNEFEGEKLTVDSEYGSADEAAIKRFQAKYKAAVLDPHGLTAPTGFVLGTTRAQINKIYCAKMAAK